MSKQSWDFTYPTYRGLRNALQYVGLERPRDALNRVFYPTPNATPTTVATRKYRRRKRAYPQQYATSSRLKYIKATCTPEVKYLDISGTITVGITGTYVTNTNGEPSLLELPQNDSANGREGYRVKVVGLTCRASLYLPAATGTSNNPALTVPQEIRYSLIVDQQCNGAAPSSISNENSGIFDSVVAYTLKNKCHYNRSRYRFLIDKTFVLPAQLGSVTTGLYGVSSQIRHIQFYKKLNIPITYDQSDTTGLISTIRNNNLFFLVGTTSHTPGLVLTHSFRLFYMDV